jgi:hypothetical protein
MLGTAELPAHVSGSGSNAPECWLSPSERGGRELGRAWHDGAGSSGGLLVGACLTQHPATSSVQPAPVRYVGSEVRSSPVARLAGTGTGCRHVCRGRDGWSRPYKAAAGMAAAASLVSSA